MKKIILILVLFFNLLPCIKKGKLSVFNVITALAEGEGCSESGGDEGNGTASFTVNPTASATVAGTFITVNTFESGKIDVVYVPLSKTWNGELTHLHESWEGGGDGVEITKNYATANKIDAQQNSMSVSINVRYYIGKTQYAKDVTLGGTYLASNF